MNQLAYLAQTKNLLDERVSKYNQLEFIETDPIQIPHRFTKKEDIEIAGFLTATISWGQRKSILKNANNLMERMDNSPYDFIMQSSTKEWQNMSDFVHRTFNGRDCLFFFNSLRNIYSKQSGLEGIFTNGYSVDRTIFSSLKHFREVFLSIPHEQRVKKHLSDVSANSAAKRLNMFLRWMVRSDDNSVDFGIWKNIPPSALMLPLDTHAGNVARELGLLQRKQNDWKAVEEITAILRTFDPTDPVKYDYALFGIGVFESKKTPFRN
jgi:uncharacterized protein (TIGR02757 family)